MLDPESGLYYYGGRYYDPELGRFISPDPFVPQPDDPQSLNRYSYVINNPVNNIDPDGYFHQVKKKKKKGGFFGGIFGAIFGFALGGPAGALIGGSLGALNDFVPEVRSVFRGLEILGGIGMMLSGNPAGFFIAASGAMSFGKGRGWQIGSQFMGLAGSAILMSQHFSSPALAEGQGGNAGQGGGAEAGPCPTCASGPPLPGDPGMEGPIEARLSNYWGPGFTTTAWGEKLRPGSGTFENPWPLAVPGRVIDGKRWSSLPKDTKVLIVNEGWGVVKDICPECTPGNPRYVGPRLGGRLNAGIMGEVRIDVFIPKDLGIKEIYIYHPPK